MFILAKLRMKVNLVGLVRLIFKFCGINDESGGIQKHSEFATYFAELFFVDKW